MKLWNKNIRFTITCILSNLSHFNRENTCCLIWKFSEFIRSSCSILRSWDIIVSQLMLISHWHPSNSIHSRAFPFIYHNIQSMMTISSSWLQKVMNFFINYLNISNLDWKWKIALRSIRASMLLESQINLLNISYLPECWKYCQKSRRQVQDRFYFLPYNVSYQTQWHQN